MKKTLFTVITYSLLISCNNAPKDLTETTSVTKTASTLKEVIVDRSSESWGGDITMHIQKIEKLTPEITYYKIVSIFKGNPIGFSFKIKQPAKKSLFVNDGITFHSLKDTSNNFLRALAEIYGVKLSNVEFKDSITVTYADLLAEIDTSKPGNMVAAQKKLFFETDDDSPELFLNIDDIAGTISLPEKDQDYREGIIKALSKNNNHN